MAERLTFHSETCPYCSADLRGKPIPEKDQLAYGGSHYKRQIGVYDMELDVTVAVRCPDCGREDAR